MNVQVITSTSVLEWVPTAALFVRLIYTMIIKYDNNDDYDGIALIKTVVTF